MSMIYLKGLTLLTVKFSIIFELVDGEKEYVTALEFFKKVRSPFLPPVIGKSMNREYRSSSINCT